MPSSRYCGVDEPDGVEALDPDDPMAPELLMLPLPEEPIDDRRCDDLRLLIEWVLDPFDMVPIEPLDESLPIVPGVPPMPVVPVDIDPLVPGDMPPPGAVCAVAAVAKAAAAARMIRVFIVVLLESRRCGGLSDRRCGGWLDAAQRGGGLVVGVVLVTPVVVGRPG